MHSIIWEYVYPVTLLCTMVLGVLISMVMWMWYKDVIYRMGEWYIRTMDRVVYWMLDKLFGCKGGR